MKNELYHYGVLGMRWGVRRYQNRDGTLTEAGKRRLKPDGTFKSNREYKKEMSEQRTALSKKYRKKYGVDSAYEQADKTYNERYDKLGHDPADGWKIYAKADKLQDKACKDVDADMRRKYGKDYDNFVKGEATKAAVTACGVIVLSTATLYGGYKALTVGGKGVINIGKKIVSKIVG